MMKTHWIKISLLKFLTVTNDKFYKMTVTLNNHHMAVKMFIKAFMEYTKIYGKYIGFYDAYSRAFEYFLQQWMSCQMQERYFRAITYKLQ